MTAGRSRIESWNCIPRLFLLLGEDMSIDEIKYTTIEQQIEKLKSQNLIINNETNAKNRLEAFGYSNLIKSYREPYMFTIDGQKKFRSGITFEQLCSLYLLDKNLRNAVMAAMLDLEEHIKEAAADVIAQSFGVHQDEYLKYRHYQNKKKRKPQFSLPAILDKMKKAFNTDKDPIHHYRETHSIVPPWILFKSVYFSTIVNFIDLMKKDQQMMLVRKLYPFSDDTEITDSQIQLMVDTLFICLEYRNAAAHGGRIYNMKCQSKLRAFDDGSLTEEGFSQLLRLLSIMKNKSPYQHLHNVLENMLNKHCSLYPEDITYLSRILNVNITSHEFVWITDRSQKYHRNEHCSGIQNAKSIDIEKVKEMGYSPCKRCCID